MFYRARRRSRRRWPLALVALAIVCFCSAARAQTGPRLLLKPFPKEQAIDAHGDALLLDQGHVKESDEDFRLSFYESQGRWRVLPGNLISPRIGWDVKYLDLETSHPGLPEQLTDQSLGVAMPVAKFGDWIVGTSLGVGYAGDSPFSDGDAWYGKASVAVFKLFNESDALIFVLDYDGNRTILPDTPLPGVAYTKRMAKDLFFIVGLPVTSIEWRPDDRLRVEFVYTMVDSFDASVGYEFTRGWTAYGGFESRKEAFHIDSLPANYDRLLFQHRRAELGLRWEPRKDNWLNLAVGYAFGQEFSSGFDSRDTDEVADVSDEPYLRVGLHLQF